MTTASVTPDGQSSKPPRGTAAAPARTRPTRAARYLLLAGIGLSMVVTGCTVTATGRPTAAADLGHWQPPPIPTTRLADLLLSASELSAIGRSGDLQVRQPVSRMWHDEDGLADRNCLDAYSPLEAAVYEGSDWTAVQGQVLDDGGPAGDPPPEHALVQAVVGFRDAGSAQQFFTDSKQRWSACANRPVAFAKPGEPDRVWAFGDAVATDTTLSMMQTREGGQGLACQRARGVRNNVIIDTMWCGFDAADQAAQVVTKIAADVVEQ
ncbi:sensor domain-containing protein [uncultured Mycobacterium sp.]|uniref:sensor domain-containing protein n=1 Tax=uncultured Mycobacterium sp. TaxID=171292 RepID=UPI0035CB42B7